MSEITGVEKLGIRIMQIVLGIYVGWMLCELSKVFVALSLVLK